MATPIRVNGELKYIDTSADIIDVIRENCGDDLVEIIEKDIGLSKKIEIDKRSISDIEESLECINKLIAEIGKLEGVKVEVLTEFFKHIDDIKYSLSNIIELI